MIYDSATQKTLSTLIAREVMTNASLLVQHLAAKPDTLTDSGYAYEDDLVPILGRYCPDDPDHWIDALEHWIVNPWFGEQLKEHDEMVTELFGFTIWGRATSGQAIALDPVIHDIADEMGILPGQDYAW